MIKRSVVLLVTVAALVAGTSFVWVEVRRERDFRWLVAEGNVALSRDQTVDAIEMFSGALTLKPASMLAHLRRGDAYRRRNELAAAVRDLRRAAALDPTAPQPLELLGDVYVALGRYASAVEQYQRFVQLDDRTARVHYKLGLARVREGRFPGAIEALRRALALDDHAAEAHYLLGVSLRGEGRARDAVASLTRAVALDGAFIPAREELADLQLALGRGREAVEQLEAIAALDRRPARFAVVGLAHARSGRPEAAVLALGRAAERYPDDPHVASALGRVWLDIGEAKADAAALGNAVNALERIALRRDASSEALTLYGRALLLTGRTRAAERAFQEATARMPVDPNAFRHLTDAASRLGHDDLARDADARYQLLERTR